MTDICTNHIVFEGPKRELVKLNSLLEKWLSEKEKTPTKYAWLGYIVKGAGFKTVDEGGFECSGNVVYLDSIVEDSNWFGIETETPNGPSNDMWYAILEKYAPKCKMYWFSYISEGKLCETNDVNKKYWDGDYVVEPNFPETHKLNNIFDNPEIIDKEDLRATLSPIYMKFTLPDIIKAVNETNTEKAYLVITPIKYTFR